jgi:ribosomal protein L11 methyltransferase
MKYLELHCSIDPEKEFIEIVIAYLATAGFSMFEELPGGLKAYILADDYDKQAFMELPIHHPDFGAVVKCDLSDADNRNWNEVWENSFEPVNIADRVVIRAQHHPPAKNTAIELVVTPRMSFGTGHHATTTLMVKAMLEIDFKNKKVLDMGCGTGVLGILASKLGAAGIAGVDIDDNATSNAGENVVINNVHNMQVYTGNAHTLVGNIYNILLANINRNIILEDIALYKDYLPENGILLLSGFYQNDLEIINENAGACGFTFVSSELQNNWCCALFIS